MMQRPIHWQFTNKHDVKSVQLWPFWNLKQWSSGAEVLHATKIGESSLQIDGHFGDSQQSTFTNA